MGFSLDGRIVGGLKKRKENKTKQNKTKEKKRKEKKRKEKKERNERRRTNMHENLVLSPFLTIKKKQGPLTNSSRIEIALGTKFFKRILSFARPDTNQLFSLPWSARNLRYVQVTKKKKKKKKKISLFFKGCLYGYGGSHSQ